MKGRLIEGFVVILAVIAVSFVWSPAVGASGLSAKAAPMSGGPNCGKRAKVYDKIWSVKAHDRRVVFLRCGEYPDPPSQGWGWRHIVARNHVAQVGWDQDFFMYTAPILTIRYEKAAGSYFRNEYNFGVVVIRRNGNALTAYGEYLRTNNCHTIEQCKQYP
jgi:hypothetical protein